MKKIFVTIFVIISFIPFNSYCKETEKRLSNKAVICLQRAEKHKEQKELNKAIDMILNFKTKYPNENHHYIEYLLGTLYLDIDNLKKAHGAFEQSVKINPLFCAGWHSAGNTAYDLGLYEKAAKAFETAYSVSEKKDSKILFASAVSYLKCNKDLKGFELLDKLLINWNKDENHVNTFTATGIKLNKQNHVLNVLDNLIEKNPDKKILLKLAANTALSQNNNKTALKYLSIYSLSGETDFKTDKLTGDLALSVNSPKRAVEFYERALKKKQDLKIYQMIISALMESSDYDNASLKAEEALKKYPDCPKLWKLNAYICYEKNDYEKSFFCASKAMKLKANDKNLVNLFAYCAGKSGKIGDAKRLLAKADNIKSLKKDAYKILGSFEQ